jgi:hypothetical protein
MRGRRAFRVRLPALSGRSPAVTSNIRIGEGKKIFFFEKKKQKTFIRFGFGLSGNAQPRRVKVFWFFFSKQNGFLSPAAPAPRSG